MNQSFDDRQETASTIGFNAMTWLAQDAELLLIFLGQSGAALDDLRAGADDPATLGAVLDFILSRDEWVRACCDSLELRYDALSAARQNLSGGADIHWT